MKFIGRATVFIVFFVALMVGVSIVNGWVLATLWRWFIPSIAPGLPSLSIPVAIGISLIAHLLTHQDMSNIAKKEKRNPTEELGGIFLVPLFTLALGWIVHQFV